MNREESLHKIYTIEKWDIIVIGGGATGLGIALDATTRGLKTLLLEKGDFSSNTSSKSTKLIHGGVRYLKQFQFKLVIEAIQERKVILKNAPHLTNIIPFIIPVYSFWNLIYYSIGLFIYELLSFRSKIGRTSILSKNKTIENLDFIKREKLKGGIRYFDGQFNDSQLCIDIARVASQNGATVINYFELIDIIKSNEIITGIRCKDIKNNKKIILNCDTLINATGIFADNIIKLDSPNKSNIILPSQGIHLVLNENKGAQKNGLMLPLSIENRVIFLIPWMGKIILGTTDTMIEEIYSEPKALEEEVDFLIRAYNSLSCREINKKDILSVFAGLRPLVTLNNYSTSTAAVSREHLIFVSNSKMITIVGGKWTTYRKMAEEVVDTVFKIKKNNKIPCSTKNISLDLSLEKKYSIKSILMNDSTLSEKIHKNYPFTKAEVLYSIKYEMATSIEDILARRNRLLFLDAKASIEAAPEVASIFEKYFKKDRNWIINQINIFENFAIKYLPE